MNIIIDALESLAVLLPPLENLIRAAMRLWRDEMAMTKTDPTLLANDATGAAQAAVDLELDVRAQIALVETTLAKEHPALSVTSRAALAAHAVAVQRQVKAMATKG